MSESEKAVMKKVTRRLIPFLFVLYIIAYLDRTNIAFAQIGMQPALKMSNTVFGYGKGIFFLGYFLFEVPSNLMMVRFGARRWITRIMVTWGLIAMAMMFIKTPSMFYILRFLLGVAEAGFFPGVILYLTYWFTAAERGRIIALFMTAIATSNVIGSPVSTFILQKMDQFKGLAGWKWVFLMEGLPAVILGFVVLAYLSDGPKSASWLTEEERALIAGRLERDPTRDQGHGSLRQAVANPALWLLCFVYFTLNVGGYGVNLWQPQIIQGFGKLTPIQLGFLNAIPSLIGGIAMVLIGMSSDRHGERRLHVAGTLAVASLGLALCAFQTQPIFGLASLSLASIGLLGFLGPFWAMPTSLLRGTAAAAGIAFINSVGNLGGYVGPSVVGAISDKTHDFKLGLLTLSSVLIIGAVTALFLNRKER